jgi:hypothetical protein
MAQVNDTIQSRFSGLGKGLSTVLILALALAMLIGCKAAMFNVLVVKDMEHSKAAATSQPTEPNGDVALYNAINIRLKNGENYYSAAVNEQRIRGYPTKPFLTVRLPTLAFVITYSNTIVMTVVFTLVSMFLLSVWLGQVYDTFSNSLTRIAAIILILPGLVSGIVTEAYVLHEIWAGALIALSLGLYRPQRFWPSFVAATFALAIRETTLPFILLMAAFAVLERRWREAAAWSALVGAFAICFVLHAIAVNSLTLPMDIVSLGWMRLGGIHGAIAAMSGTSLLLVFPSYVGGLLIPLSLFGWASWHNAIGVRGALYIAGYGFMLTIIGRETNFYWGLMVAPLLLLGLAFVPRALADLLLNFKANKLGAFP